MSCALNPNHHHGSHGFCCMIMAQAAILVQWLQQGPMPMERQLFQTHHSHVLPLFAVHFLMD